MSSELFFFVKFWNNWFWKEKLAVFFRSADKQEITRKEAKLSLMLKDLKEELRNNVEGKAKLDEELEDLQRIIDEKEREVEIIRPKVIPSNLRNSRLFI